MKQLKEVNPQGRSRGCAGCGRSTRTAAPANSPEASGWEPRRGWRHPRRPEKRPIRGRHQLRLASTPHQGSQFVNNGVASTQPQWSRLYEQFVNQTLNQVKGA